jgi:hypothetical protein
MDYKFGAKGNSGIFLRAWTDGDISGSQFVEVQLIDDAGYKMSGLTGTGAIFKRVPPNPVPVTKLNDWNSAVVRVVGKRVTVTINGTKCVDSDVEFPRAKGVIGLQQLDSPVEFRNVRVRDLSAAAPDRKGGVIEPTAKAGDDRGRPSGRCRSAGAWA